MNNALMDIAAWNALSCALNANPLTHALGLIVAYGVEPTKSWAQEGLDEYERSLKK